jgi:shikimate kinase
MSKNIVLIGFMGTGKSTVGIKLAQRLKRQFVDIDKEIENLNGMSVNDIFRRYGEIRFRSEEKLMAAKLSKRDNLVIATGGGLVLWPENIAALKENGILICLEADPEDIFGRVSRKKGTRPLLKKNYNVDDIRELLKAREEYYNCADFKVNTSGKDLDMVVNEILHKYRSI